MNRVTEVLGVQMTLSMNPTSQQWEVWACGVCEDFPSRTSAVWHMRQLARALGGRMDTIPPGF